MAPDLNSSIFINGDAMPGRILIVDDDAIMLEALTGMVDVRLPTVIIDTCQSASAALEHIGQSDYDGR